MLYTLGLDSEFALLETVLTGFYDTFPKTRRYKFWLTLAACVLCFLISIPCFSLSGQVRRSHECRKLGELITIGNEYKLQQLVTPLVISPLSLSTS